MKNLMTRMLTKAYCKRIAKRFGMEDVLTFYSADKGYAVSFQGLLGLYPCKDWQHVNVQVFKTKENGEVEGVAYYPKRTNSFMQLNPFGHYFDGFYKLKNGEIKSESASKKEIRMFKKAIWWFPFSVNVRED